ncbi:MAG: glycosyltransferase [Acidimicrobiales bacterium]
MPATAPYVLFVGTLGRFKGVHALVDIWRRAQPAAELVLLGTEAPDTPTDLPPGVTMHFDVPHAEVLAVLAHCQFSVLPSQFPEPSPTVVLEPMALGRPVIANAIGDSRPRRARRHRHSGAASRPRCT